jgi:hypothetical protein
MVDMTLKSDQQRYFRTTSLVLATFLCAKGRQVAGVHPTDSSSKKEFAFISDALLEKLVDAYKFGERDSEDLLVAVHLYEHARNEMLDRLNE